MTVCYYREYLRGEALNVHSEREDFAKSARRDVLDPFHMKMQ